MISRRRLNFTVDFVAGVFFLLSMFAGDGEAFHLVVALAFTAVLSIHLYLHRRWFMHRIMKRMVSRSSSASRRARTNFAIDMLILIAFSIAFASGIALMLIPDDVAAAQAHGISSVAFIAGAILHIALHWGWIMACIKAARTAREDEAERAGRYGVTAIRAQPGNTRGDDA
jgi:cation transport ATPase